MKQKYQINLDKEAMDALDRWLEAAGLKRSTFFNLYLVKVVQAMNLKKIEDYKKLTAQQIFSMFKDIGKMTK